VAFTHQIDRLHPLQPDEAVCRRCQRAFLPWGGRKTYCSPECSAQPVSSPEAKARRREADRIRGTDSRGSAAQRGYGEEHRKRRAKLLPEAIGTLCPLCHFVMEDWQKLDLDHIMPLGRGGQFDGEVRVTHARCNRSRGDGRRRRW
jgi:hypothetical protein